MFLYDRRLLSRETGATVLPAAAAITPVDVTCTTLWMLSLFFFCASFSSEEELDVDLSCVYVCVCLSLY